jgi:hypothetical protein
MKTLDSAHRVRALVAHDRYAGAEWITLAYDDLNTHTPAALQQSFGPAEALRMAKEQVLDHTPKHGSWLEVAEPKLYALTREGLVRCIDTQAQVAGQDLAWKDRRNEKKIGAERQFTTAGARIKLKHL